MTQPSRLEQTKLISRMFGRIARRYDTGNRILSLGQDQAWRRKATDLLDVRRHHRVLDIGAGTGDLSLLLAGRAAAVTGLDVSEPMIRLGRAKAKALSVADRVSFVVADAMRLPFPPSTFDRVAIAFTVRNLPELAGGFMEIHRVLAPGGRMACLEFTQPTSPVVRSLYQPYLNRILPFVGGQLSGDPSAYRYLARSISSFPTAEVLAEVINQAGFERVDWHLLNLGTVAIHLAAKLPQAAALPAEGARL